MARAKRPKQPKRALSLRTRFTLFLGLTAFITSAALTVFSLGAGVVALGRERPGAHFGG